MCMKTSAELLSIPCTVPLPLHRPAPEKFTSMFFVFDCYLLFHNAFYEGARRFPPWSPKTMWPGPTWSLWAWRSHWWPWNVVVISLLVCSDQHRHFSEGKQGPFQVWSQLWLCPDCVTSCVHIVVSGTCIYQLGFGRRMKSSYREYTQLPRDLKKKESRYAQSTPSSPNFYFSTSGSTQEKGKFNFSSLVLSGRLFLCKLIGV